MVRHRPGELPAEEVALGYVLNAVTKQHRLFRRTCDKATFQQPVQARERNHAFGPFHCSRPHHSKTKSHAVTRGGLSHWVRIEGGRTANYQLVVPSTWNLGPRCGAGKLSPVEESLVGVAVADPERPVEIVRTVHSFDPCIACAVHLMESDRVRVIPVVSPGLPVGA